ncbi:MAG TPA: hypothetical protein VLT33_07650 [Labilithrix sp.]|nr:hypothetical protein [Labilithrix sp.]
MTPRVLSLVGSTALAAVVVHAAACSSSSTSPPVTPDDGAAEAAPSSLPQTCARGPKRTDKPATCNGAAELCARTYDRVTVPMTHNAMSNADDGWATPNQTHGLARQLDDGVRGMMLDLHYYDAETNENVVGHTDGKSEVDQVYLCHGPCALGHLRLLDGLCTITRFLDEHPAEVFSIIFENDVTDADTDAVVRASGFGDYVYTHPRGAPWPTLREMIDTNKRLVLFLEQNGGTPGYLHRAYADEMWDTPYSFAKKEDFTCALGRGDASHSLFLVNHFLGNGFADIALARDANTTKVLGDRIATCTTAAKRPPTFVSVDFYEVGDLFGAVRTANGL